jgi:hypothetical protein
MAIKQQKTEGELKENHRHTVLFSLLAMALLRGYVELYVCSSPKPFGTARAITRR